MKVVKKRRYATLWQYLGLGTNASWSPLLDFVSTKLILPSTNSLQRVDTRNGPKKRGDCRCARQRVNDKIGEQRNQATSAFSSPPARFPSAHTSQRTPIDAEQPASAKSSSSSSRKRTRANDNRPSGIFEWPWKSGLPVWVHSYVEK